MERAIWQDIVQRILHSALRVQIQMFVEFGETFFDKEFAWSESDDKDYGTGAGFKFFKLPLRAALREVTLRAMLQDIESAFPKTFSAVSTEGSKVQARKLEEDQRHMQAHHRNGPCVSGKELYAAGDGGRRPSVWLGDRTRRHYET